MGVSASWAWAEVARSEWLDPRQQRSFARMLDRLCENAGVSWSCALGEDGRQAARRLLVDDRMSVDEALSGHYDETAARCREHEVVLVAQDTTSVDYSRHRASKADLGPMSGAGSWGVMAHDALAMTEAGLPLGVLGLQLWTRDPEARGKRHARRTKSTQSKESHKWLEGLRSIEKHVGSGPQLVVLSDRESDVFDYFACARSASTDLVVRASHPRRVEVAGAEGSEVDLFEALAAAPGVGAMEVEVSKRADRPSRLAEVQLHATVVSVQRPRGRELETDAESVSLTAVRAWEPSPPEGESGVEWCLLTSLPVTDEASARRVVGYYTRRWQVEVLHRVLKTGLRAEQLQVSERHVLFNALAVYWIVAWRLLWMTHVARTEPERSAADLVTAEELAVLGALAGSTPSTAAEVVAALAKLGGHQQYKKAPPPGPQRLWVGLRRVQDMLVGWRLAKAAPDL